MGTVFLDKDKAENFEYQSVRMLNGVGPAVAEKLKRLEIYNIQDVLFHLPLRYEDRTKLTALGSLQLGQQALVEGIIDHCEIKYGGSLHPRRAPCRCCAWRPAGPMSHRRRRH